MNIKCTWNEIYIEHLLRNIYLLCFQPETLRNTQILKRWQKSFIIIVTKVNQNNIKLRQTFITSWKCSRRNHFNYSNILHRDFSVENARIEIKSFLNFNIWFCANSKTSVLLYMLTWVRLIKLCFSFPLRMLVMLSYIS